MVRRISGKRSFRRFPTRSAVRPMAGAMLALRYALRRKVARKRANWATPFRRMVGAWPMRAVRRTGGAAGLRSQIRRARK